jgi:hypothetical protein
LQGYAFKWIVDLAKENHYFMKSIYTLALLLSPMIFSACEQAELTPEMQILGDWRLISSEALLHIKDKQPEQTKSELATKNLVMTFEKDGTYEIKVDDRNVDVNMVDLDAFYLNNKGTYAFKAGFLEFKSSEFESDITAIKYKVAFNNNDAFEMEVDRELYLEMIRKLVVAQWAYFQTMGKTVDEVMAELSVDLVEFKSRSKYLRVK